MKHVSYVFNQGIVPDYSLKTTGDAIVAKCQKVGRSAVTGGKTFLSLTPASNPKAKDLYMHHLPILHLFTVGEAWV